MIREILTKALSDSDNQTTLQTLFHAKLATYGISKTQFEHLVGISRRTLDGILKGESKQTDIISLLKLGEFLELSEHDLLVMFFKQRSAAEMNSLTKSLELTYINKFFDIKELTKIGLLDKQMSLEEIKSTLCSFLGLKSIYDYTNGGNYDILFSRTKRTFEDKMRDFWIRSSYSCFESIKNPYEYDRKALLRLVPNIKQHTLDVENGLAKVCRALYLTGVTVILQSSLPKNQVRGATFSVNDKPCIVLTDLNKKYSTIWFALIHELYHVLFDFEEHIQKNVYHLTGEPDIFLIEDKADKFAAEYLLKEDRYRYIKPLIQNHEIVVKCAQAWKVHPAIIYGQFQHRIASEGKNYWGAFKDYDPGTEVMSSKINKLYWNSDTPIKEAAEKMYTHEEFYTETFDQKN